MVLCGHVIIRACHKKVLIIGPRLHHREVGETAVHSVRQCVQVEMCAYWHEERGGYVEFFTFT